jgi:manganese-dependent inorganic pyrophosphatase
MLKAGTDLSDLSVEGLLTTDAKVFEMNGFKAEIAQINTIDIKEVLTRQSEIEQAMNKAIADKGLELFLFVITDIMNSNSQAIALGSQVAKIEHAFGVTLENNSAFLEGVVSRKKQIVPPLEKIV